MKIISPAYKLPNNLKPCEIGFANKDTPSKNKFIGIKISFINKFFEVKGCKVNSPTNPPTQQNENHKNNLWLLAEVAAGCGSEVTIGNGN